MVEHLRKSIARQAPLGHFGEIIKSVRKIWRRSDTFVYTPNGTFSSNKESKIKFNFIKFSESKIIAGKFYSLPGKQTKSYDVIIDCDLTKQLQIDVLCSEDVLVWDGVRLPMQKIQNGKWTDLNLMYQEDPDDIKEKSIRLGRKLDANYERSDLEQEVNELIHITKFQRVLLLICLKLY